MSTKIEWTDETWNPITGCYGPGGSAEQPCRCSYCYAYRMARRLQGRYGYPEAPHFFDPTIHPNRLKNPLHWRKPRMVFVCSMADLFGPWVPDDWIESVLDVVAQTPRHTYQFLTKWPDRLARWNPWPKNAWVGASAENWTMLDIATGHLKRVFAPVRFVSCEPWDMRMMNETCFQTATRLSGADWIIIGQKTGPRATKYTYSTIASPLGQLLDAAITLDIPVFIKPPLADVWPNAPQEWPSNNTEDQE